MSLYIDLLKKCLCRSVFGGGSILREIEVQELQDILGISSWSQLPGHPRLAELLVEGDLRLVMEKVDRGVGITLEKAFDPALRAEGSDWPVDAETMIGMKRLDNIQLCVENVLQDNVPGDLVEAGVWRGGATILMRGILKDAGDTDRKVWVADSFEGLPKPDVERYPKDEGLDLWRLGFLSVPLDKVRENFRRYGLLDDQVRFLKGWFKDTLPTAPIEGIAVLRLDGDMYESIMDTLRALYHKVSSGGFVIVDDYYILPPCRAAVDEFRSANGIFSEVWKIDFCGAYWRIA